MRSLAFVTLLLLALAISGCSNKEAALVGKWKAQPPAGAAAGAEATMPELELSKDKTFKMSIMEGTWSLAGNDVSLQVQKFMGKSLDELKKQAGNAAGSDAFDKPLKGTLSADGNTLSVAPPAGANSSQTLTFTKEKV